MKVVISLVVLITLLLLWEKGQSRAGPKKNEIAPVHAGLPDQGCGILGERFVFV